jgi:hypothetical protein
MCEPVSQPEEVTKRSVTQSGPQFVTILRRQRDDAAAHADHTRTKLYDELVRVIDDTTTR